jgi:membrane protease YdiL (CAAX protease family)
MTPAPQPDKIGILLRVGLFILIGWMSMMVFTTVMLLILGPDSLLVTSAMSVFVGAALANAITVRVYERGRLSDLGLGWMGTSGREFLIGAGAAIAGAVVVAGGPLAVGAAHFEAVPTVEHRWASFAFVSIVLLFGAFGEEMLFHGYAFQLLIRSLGPFATILPVSIIFGLAHIGNQNASIFGIFNTFLWGVLLGFAYLRTRALWLSIGLHFGWNFALPLFGVNLSGFTMGVTGYALRWRVGTLWSGGNYGPEGSVLTTVIVIALFVGVLRVFRDPDEV